MKFYTVIGNPPYKGNLYVKFLNLAYELTSKYVLFVHPSTIYLKHNLKKKLEIEFINNVRNKIRKLFILNGNEVFENVGMWVPAIISFIDKDKNSQEIYVVDKLNKTEYIYESIEKINKFGNISEYFSLKDKILLYCKEKGNLQSKCTRDNKIEKVFYINLAGFRGHMSDDKSNPYASDFYTMIPRNAKAENKITNNSHFGFDTESEASNFLNYLKTDFARFCLSIYKKDMHLWNELSTVPYLDFTKSWTDDKLYQLFDVTDKEIKFIEANISKYY